MAYPFENKRFNPNIKTGELFQIHGMGQFPLNQNIKGLIFH